MTDLLIMLLWLIGGGVIGLIYFHTVGYTANLMVSGRRGGPWFGAALVVLRLSSLGGLLLILAIQGAGPLLAATLGLLIGRSVVMRAARGAD